MQDSVGFGIDSSVQPVLFVIDSDCLLIDRNSIRCSAVDWLDICFLDPALYRCSTPLDP